MSSANKTIPPPTNSPSATLPGGRVCWRRNSFAANPSAANYNSAIHYRKAPLPALPPPTTTPPTTTPPGVWVRHTLRPKLPPYHSAYTPNFSLTTPPPTQTLPLRLHSYANFSLTTPPQTLPLRLHSYANFSLTTPPQTPPLPLRLHYPRKLLPDHSASELLRKLLPYHSTVPPHKIEHGPDPRPPQVHDRFSKHSEELLFQSRPLR